MDDLASALHGDVGDGLRCVAEYTRDGYDVVYVRDDVEPRLSAVGEEIHQDLIIQGVGREHLEAVFDAGDLHCSAHRFEEVTAVHFVGDDHTGLFVSVDSDAEIRLDALAERCRGHL